MSLMKKLPNWCLTNPSPAFYETESGTAIEQTAKVYGAMNELIDATNEFADSTTEHIREQDEDIKNQKEVVIPKKIADEVQRHIDDGSFETVIDEHLGNLEARVNNMLSSIPEGGTTSDAELVDVRTGVNGGVSSNAGEAVRNVDRMQSIEYGAGLDNFYISANGTVLANNAMVISEKISVLPGESLVIEVLAGNEYISSIAYTYYESPNEQFDRFVTAEPGVFTVTVPAGARFAFISWQKTTEKPRLWVVKSNPVNSLKSWCNSPMREFSGEEIQLDFINAKRFSNGVWYDPSPYKFKVSQAIPVTEGEVFSIENDLANQYCALAIFQNSDVIANENVVYYIQNEYCGKHLVIAPKGAKYLFVRNSVTASDNEIGSCVVKRLGWNIFDVLGPAVTNDNVVISIPDEFKLVKGETFELFYDGVIKANDLQNYNIKITCDAGKAYKRKYVYTPSGVGSHTLRIRVLDNNGSVLADKSTTLKVVDKLNTNLTRNILCVGDSLTASGEWVNEVNRMMKADGLTNISFVGRKGTSAKYEATGGWTIDYYISNDAEKNPFYNPSSGKVDIAWYVNTYCSGTLDTLIIFLGWNSTNKAKDAYKANMKTFIDLVRSDFPNVKILLYGLQIPSIDGFGESYGCSWNFREKVDFVFSLNDWLVEIASEYDGVRFVNIAGQFDTRYGMPYEERTVNKRSAVKEIVGTNGVHPNYDGYMQIADVGYRELHALYSQTN